MSWRILLAIFVAVILVGGSWWYTSRPTVPSAPPAYVLDEEEQATSSEVAAGAADPSGSVAPAEPGPVVTTVAENLSIPWEVLFLPDGELLVTERPGTVLLLKQGTAIEVEGVQHVGEGGLLGAALHPNFADNQYLYLYHTTETDAGLRNRIVRYVLRGSELAFDRVVLDDIPGARYHDGGRLAFGPDGFLYATVGDATEAAAAQNTNTIAGSIIRLTAEGEVPADNPFSDSYIYSYGHRNPQGLAWDETGQLWSSEHGRSVAASGFDELNRIDVGGNYGWPESEGDEVAPGTIAPIRHSTADVTWAPGGLAYLDGSFYLPGLRGETLYEAVVENGEVLQWREHLVGQYGRLRTVTVGPDGFLYLTTSNRDGRGDTPAANDDLLLRIDPTQL